MPSKQEEFWNDRKHHFPYHVEVPHLSPQDLDPKDFSQRTRHRFLRVPFDGVAHWGFDNEKTRDYFKALSDSKKFPEPQKRRA